MKLNCAENSSTVYLTFILQNMIFDGSFVTKPMQII